MNLSKAVSLNELRRTYGDRIDKCEEVSANRAYVYLSPAVLPKVARFLHKEHNGRLATVTGVDTRDGIELLYHFLHPQEHLFITLKTRLDKPSPEIESLASLFPAAIWIERELYDLLGVTFTGHPDLRRLVLPDSWPEGVHPLRRDFKGLSES
jgi:Ni,Fe-hydrogenase III component G